MPAAALVGDDLEVQRTAPDQHAQGDECRELARPRQGVEADGNLPGARHAHDLDIGRRDAMGEQGGLGPGEEAIHDRAVESRRDDPEAPPGAVQGEGCQEPPNSRLTPFK